MNILFKKFSHFLLIGLSSLVLFAGVQSGMVGDFTQRGPNQVLADNEQDCGTGSDQPGCPNPGVDLGEVPFIPPAAPAAPAPSCSDDHTYCDTNVNQMIHKTGGYWNGSECVYAFVPVGVCNQAAPQPQPQPGNQCTPNGQIGTVQDCVGENWCTFNIWRGTDCSTGRGGAYGCQRIPGRCGVPNVCVPNGSCSAPTPACGQTTTGVDNCNHACSRQGPACPITPPQPLACPTTGEGTRLYCNGTVRGYDECSLAETYPDGSPKFYNCKFSGNSNCIGSVTCPAPPGVPVCVSNGSCSAPTPACGQTTTGVDNCTNRCTKTGAACAAPPVAPPPAPITITNPTTVTNTNTNTNTNTITVQGAAGATREVIREVQTFGNVGVGTSAPVVYYAGVKQLPSTGLPALAWAAAAFIPAGFKIRRFSKVKEETAAKPHFLWEERQFHRS